MKRILRFLAGCVVVLAVAAAFGACIGTTMLASCYGIGPFVGHITCFVP